ncbi:Rieske domain-containing protein [Fusarium keratoplasticum]|uniref:Rieske domain-containing protein n=1 Tax=Fusarium keratoplasticum TaxID=1328300 RepID=A0ACC0QQ60_9HYPO|nr:Rieske domain-containing protein [Fusarium keratoplasticum]KAI8660320.1 Rieske domain-containing protein [Fusarium keratoplasticum]KAI8661342.1 Rieske domain-containing protein [Fusarium keratoplasticum]
MNAFRPFFRQGADWAFVGHSSSFPDIGADDAGNLSKFRQCKSKSIPGCKAFHVSKENSSKSEEVPVGDDALAGELTDQVLVFQYKGKFHAVDHSCPHSSYPLSQGTPFDIEDFGMVLSAGLTCPKHGWSFDVFSGMSDRGSYRLKVWEVQLRDMTKTETSHATEKAESVAEVVDKEVWVRRKQRIG